jgi:hypothetical protein
VMDSQVTFFFFSGFVSGDNGKGIRCCNISRDYSTSTSTS